MRVCCCRRRFLTDAAALAGLAGRGELIFSRAEELVEVKRLGLSKHLRLGPVEGRVGQVSTDLIDIIAYLPLLARNRVMFCIASTQQVFAFALRAVETLQPMKSLPSSACGMTQRSTSSKKTPAILADGSTNDPRIVSW
jgi:hypothetical protein